MANPPNAPEGNDGDQNSERTFKMQRGVSQLLFNYLPHRTVDWEDGLAVVQLGNVRLPPALSPAAEHVIRESSTDLRSGMLDVIVGAQESLLIASPFWDAGTSEEIAKLAKKRLGGGVSVTILGRFSRDLPVRVRAELRKIAKDANCSILSWFEGSGNDTQTFHFKAISADRGARAYLGSANMTVSSLRSRMELGVVLTGKVAEELDRVLRVVLTLASPISL